jgi:hypothetical protein
MPALRSFRSAVVAALGLGAGLTGCSNAGDDLGLSVQPTGIVSVLVYLDRDGSHTPTTPDTLFAGARVALLLGGSQDTVRTAASAATGIAQFDAVPVGQYRVAIAPSTLGDSLQVAAIDSTNIRLSAGDPNRQVVVRLGYPEVSIRAARALPPGRRVLLRGIILAGVQSFRDTTSHLADTSGQIRLTRVSLRGGILGNNPGDSASVIGTTSTRAGQPTLDLSVITRLSGGPAPIPSDLSTATAAGANGGALDAALVRIIRAVIADTMTVAPDFILHVSDGTGTLTVVIDPTLQVPKSVFSPGFFLTARGVLVPNGGGGWSLKPRIGGGGGDIQLETQ